MPSLNPVVVVSAPIEDHSTLQSETLHSNSVITPFETMILWSESLRVKQDGRIPDQLLGKWYGVNNTLCTISWALGGRDCWKEVNLIYP